MRNVLWICAAVASCAGAGRRTRRGRWPLRRRRSRALGALPEPDRRTRPARRAGAPTSPRWSERGLQVGSVGLLGDVYFGSTHRQPRATSVGGFRATSGLLIGGRSPGSAPSRRRRRAACSRRTGTCSALRPRRSTYPAIRRSTTRRSLHRHRLQQPVGRRAAGASAPTSASSRRARATSSASAASSAARRASTTSSATCAWRRSSSSASRIPSDPLDRAFAGKVA